MDDIALSLGRAHAAASRVPLAVSQAQWSWFGGVFNVGLMIGFFLVEFAIRQRRFPGRYASLVDFLRQMARLGPEFWRGVAH